MITEVETPEERIHFAFETATSRAPSERELSILLGGFTDSIDSFSENKEAALSYAKSEDFLSDQFTTG